MPISLYNSLTRRKELIEPLNPPEINIYTCGVTVYDESHIGHARSLYIFDLIRRYLEYSKYKVNFVRNITDIDDKIINRANELKTDWQGLAQKYIDSYEEDLRLLNINKGILEEDGKEPRATNSVDDIKKYIEILIDKGYAYVTDTGVYFSVRRFKDYGKLSGQSIEQMLTGVRKEPDETKRDPLDFALWKKSKPGEPFWSSPWGDGRPGWHIECSVMSQKFLKTDTLDIHAGGRDLIFPHHENEIAQSEAKTGERFAKYWIHHGLLTINGQKMAKSLGNFVTVKDFIKKYPADILKIFFLQAHYASPIDFSENKIKEVCSAYERFSDLFNRLQEHFGTKDLDKVITGGTDDKNQTIFKMRQSFQEAMDNDFNTPIALGVLFDLISYFNKMLDHYEDGYQFILRNAWDLFSEVKQIFSLTFDRIDISSISDDSIELNIKLRENLRKSGDFTKADQIRKELEGKGILLKDTKDGKTTWRRKI